MTAPLREQQTFDVTIASGEKTSSAIQLSGFGDALFHIPSGFTTPNYVTYVGTEKYGGTYSKIVNSTPEEISTQVTSDAWHEFPSAVFGLHSVKIVASDAQSAARTIKISGHG